MAVRNRVCGPTQCGITALTPRCTKGGCKLDDGQRMPGAGLSCRRSRKAPLGKPTFQPYWGKPAVRNDREDRGNVGIIRSPLRASILPDSFREEQRQFGSQLPIWHAGWMNDVVIAAIFALTGWSPSLNNRPNPPPIG